MRSARTGLRSPLLQRLMPLAYGLAAMIGLILGLTWGALQIQVTLAGFLNGESLWSKAQKQAVIDVENYAVKGDPADLASFKRNYAVVQSDRWARDAIAGGHYDKEQVFQAFRRGGVIPSAIPGMVFMLQYFAGAPNMREAMEAWHSVDDQIAELDTIANELEYQYAHGGLSNQELVRQRERIHVLNQFIEPRSNRFSVYIAKGATWLGQVLFACMLLVTALASLIWFSMARRTLAGIRGTEERYRLLFDSAASAIVMVDEGTGHILDANRMTTSWTGRKTHELVGEPFSQLFASVGFPQEGSMSLLRDANGDTRPVEMQSALAMWGERSVRQAIISDISERVEMEHERRIASKALAGIAEAVIIADAERRVTTVNAAYTRITGYELPTRRDCRFDETRRLPDGSPLPESVWETVANGGNWKGEVSSLRSDGSSYPELLSISAIRDTYGSVQHYVAVFTDITATKADRQRLEHLATHDPLTGLVNRAEFERRCEQAILSATHERSAVAVLFVDLDAFKVVNDSYSHAVGDSLLVQVAERIERMLGKHDIAGRIGGDEFTVLLGKLATREDARGMVNRMLARLSEPMMAADYEIVLSASIGIAGFPLDGGDPITLITNADAAMYVAKTEERNAYRFYTPLMHADARRRLMLGVDLRQALSRDEFHLYYQPNVDLRSGRIVAVEALLRWRHPERGMLLPDEFIPMAESLGLIRQIDEWVIGEACAQLRRWDDARVPPLRMAINVSASTFGHRSFIGTLGAAMDAQGLPGSRLLIEITESAILRLGEQTDRAMHALHALGVGVAIDDFGTGYSSLAYLKLSAVAVLKIDRSFINGLPEDTNNVAITEAMLAIARSLSLRPIAEGIETQEQHDFLLRAGCAEGQGFFYARPQPAEEIARMVQQSNPRHAVSRLRLVPPEHTGSRFEPIQNVSRSPFRDGED
ncbi:putative bifunctional diguanylate cyclase/phosphodiesterase [Dyella subtropica]|uniref:putative bifunctional diguanylate cyclase/phosphodiesterase n=1 Tax=Dyella subtropica TaxID=2992127 RepID=UPI002253B199|nr:EAL domain-containing protein [Dyella subtropica]